MMDKNEIRKEVTEMRNNGESERKIAKSLGFKSILDYRKKMSDIERERLDTIGYYEYEY